MNELERLRDALVRIRGYAAKSSRQDAPATLHMIMALVDAALEERPAAPDTRPELTDRQTEILGHIGAEIATRGYPPSVREIGRKFDIKSPNGVMANLVALERKGYIRREPNLSRAIVLIGAAS